MNKFRTYPRQNKPRWNPYWNQGKRSEKAPTASVMGILEKERKRSPGTPMPSRTLGGDTPVLQSNPSLAAGNSLEENTAAQEPVNSDSQ